MVQTPATLLLPWYAKECYPIWPSPLERRERGGVIAANSEWREEEGEVVAALLQILSGYVLKTAQGSSIPFA